MNFRMLLATAVVAAVFGFGGASLRQPDDADAQLAQIAKTMKTSSPDLVRQMKLLRGDLKTIGERLYYEEDDARYSVAFLLDEICSTLKQKYGTCFGDDSFSSRSAPRRP